MPKTEEWVDLAHRRSVEDSIPAIASFLQETMGQKLVAHVVGTRDPKVVGLWAKGERRPRKEAEERLRAIYQIAQLLLDDSLHTVRAWFVGMNPQLDDESPADVAREGRLKDVLVAAKSYVIAGGTLPEK